MPDYRDIKDLKNGKRTAGNLLKLQDALNAIPQRNVFGNLLLATWNLREFGPSKFKERGDEPIHYIAEIIHRFDLVAIQEVREDLTVLNNLRRKLGPWWDCVFTDVTAGAAGNGERMAFLFDKRKLVFSGLAGEIVLPPGKGKEQLARTPYIVGFKSGWFEFTICTTHIYYGTEAKDNPRRVQEIKELAKFLAQRVKGEQAWPKNMILLGDFNIFDPGDVTFKAITEAGFVVPEQLTTLHSDFGQKHHYDQIAFITPEMEPGLKLCKAGVFNFFDVVYRKEDERLYATEVPAKAGYDTWRTFQMSDHLPMWIELQTDHSHGYLEKLAKGTAVRAAA